MSKLSLWRKFKLFLEYRDQISKIEKALLTDFNTRIDGAHRLYTVINVPQELIEEPYNLRKSDIDVFAQNFIKDYSSQLSRFLNSRGLNEMYDFYEVTKVDKYSYLVVIGFSLFNTQKIYTNFFYIFLPIFGLVTTLVSLFLDLK